MYSISVRDAVTALYGLLWYYRLVKNIRKVVISALPSQEVFTAAVLSGNKIYVVDTEADKPMMSRERLPSLLHYIGRAVVLLDLHCSIDTEYIETVRGYVEETGGILIVYVGLCGDIEYSDNMVVIDRGYYTEVMIASKYLYNKLRLMYEGADTQIPFMYAIAETERKDNVCRILENVGNANQYIEEQWRQGNYEVSRIIPINDYDAVKYHILDHIEMYQKPVNACRQAKQYVYIVKACTGDNING